MPPDVSQTPHPSPRLGLGRGIFPVRPSGLLRDILAGVTLAALGIPEVMGYTKIIGTPVVTGLYTMLLPVAVFAFFGASRHLVVAADSATAAMVAAALAALNVAGSPKYVALTGLVALAAGGMLLLARLLRLGFLADFLSRTVLVGFLTGVGVQVACGEIHGMLGLPHGGHGVWGHISFIAQHRSDLHLGGLLISAGVLGLIVVCERFAPRVPGALLAVVGAIAASAWFDWGRHGVQLLGSVPGGLPHLGLPDVAWADIWRVLPIAFSCFVVILAQSAATSRAFALRYGEDFGENGDLLGLCLANVAAGCSGTFVVNGSPTKTAIVDTAGGRSQVAHLAAAAVVLLVLLFFTAALSHLPNAVLATIVFVIGAKLVDYRGLVAIARKSWDEFTLAIVTAATVVLVGVEQGILVAIVLSLLDHVRHGYHPHTAVVLDDPVEYWRMAPVEPGKMIAPGLVMYWFGADLYYANANYFAQQVRLLVNQSPTPVRWLVIDAGAITDIDCSAGNTLGDLQRELDRRGVVLALTRVSDGLRADLQRQELVTVIGAGRIFDSRRQCLTAYNAAEPARG